MVDAYFWLHPPGVSDGCSSANRCTRIEPACSWVDALGARPREAAAPAAGELFLPKQPLAGLCCYMRRGSADAPSASVRWKDFQVIM